MTLGVKKKNLSQKQQIRVAILMKMTSKFQDTTMMIRAINSKLPTELISRRAKVSTTPSVDNGFQISGRQRYTQKENYLKRYCIINNILLMISHSTAFSLNDIIQQWKERFKKLEFSKKGIYTSIKNLILRIVNKIREMKMFKKKLLASNYNYTVNSQVFS